MFNLKHKTMCKEQMHKEPAGQMVMLCEGSALVSGVGARNWAFSHNPVHEFRLALETGVEHEPEHVLNILFALVTMRYQGFVEVWSEDGEVWYLAVRGESITIPPQPRAEIEKRFQDLIDAQEDGNIRDVYLAWYTHEVAKGVKMPFPHQLWRDMVHLADGVWPTIAEYELNHLDGQPVSDESDEDVVITFLRKHRFDVLGRMVQEGQEDE